MTDPPKQLGPYTVDREIGRGGMGVVYLGHDTSLDRPVAIKALPEHLAQDPDRLARFEREARTLAALTHPNVAGIYGIEQHDGAKYLILEYVEGETLAERLDRGALPVEEALELAIQIAAGVEAAHEAGVIHRDLKPDNIKITPDGQVKVLDFGLAKSTETQTTSSSTNIPTITSPAILNSPTIPGAIMGTAPYMSPEQARGRTVDKRSDIWSFGVILYEMLTSASPFRGETVSDSIGAILHKDVDLALLPADTPGSVGRVLVRCLERDKTKRYRDIGDAALDLCAPDGAHAAETVSGSSISRFIVLLIFLVGITVGALAVRLALTPSVPPAEVVRFEVDLEREGELSFGFAPGFALSHDGSKIAYAAESEDVYTLFVRDINEPDGVRLTSDRAIGAPFFSPDGQWIAYFTEKNLMKISVKGGSPIKVAPVTESSRGGAWGPDDTILFSPSTISPLYRVSASGGTPEQITTLDTETRERSHRWPSFIPGQPNLVVITNELHDQSFDESAIEVLDLETGVRRHLCQGGSYSRVTPDGTLIFAGAGTLYAGNFENDFMSLSDAPTPIIYGLSTSSGNGGAQYAFSNNGTLIFVEGSAIDMAVVEPVWVGFDGQREDGIMEPGAYQAPRISPDGSRLTYQTGFLAPINIMIHEFRRGISAPVYPTDDDYQYGPIWSPDGQWIVYSGQSSDHFVPSLFMMSSSGERPPTRLGKAMISQQVARDWSPDGTKILFSEARNHTKEDLLIYNFETEEIEEFVASPEDDRHASFSPDGRWVAYSSTASGDWEIYLRRLDGAGARQQVSVGGGIEPIWAPDGSAVYYLASKESIDHYDLMRVAIETTDDAAVISAPEKKIELDLIFQNQNLSRRYDIDPSGDRILALQYATDLNERQRQRINVVLNWFEELEAPR